MQNKITDQLYHTCRARSTMNTTGGLSVTP